MKHMTRISKTPAAAIGSIFNLRPGPLGQNELGDTVVWLLNLVGLGFLLPAGFGKSTDI